ncbi:TPA: glycosyltransferase family 2 protein [Escherichia albertii]|nr:glycosyltransferase family 2 protein [Escherichia albertii]MDD9751176.1 glycosyltransferase family 2 protein [Escherichia albertii]
MEKEMRNFSCKDPLSLVENQIVLSIILPVYNVSEYLIECLNSLLLDVHECYLNRCEVIVVDDGSTDNSSELMREYSLQYPEIVKIYSKSNGGLSDARNYGLLKSSGKYISFVDSDDVVNRDFIKKIINIIDMYDFDILSFDFIRFFNKRPPPVVSEIGYITQMVERVDPDFYKSKPVFAWNKVYRRYLFDNEIFPKGWYYEDVALIPLLLDRAKRLYHINSVCYFYRQRQGAITFFNDNKYLDILKGVSFLYGRSQSTFIKTVIINQFFTLTLLSLRLPTSNYFMNMRYIVDTYCEKFELDSFEPELILKHIPFLLLKKLKSLCVYPLYLFKPAVYFHKQLKHFRGRLK